MEAIKELLETIFRKKSINGQNQLINKSTGRVVSCNEFKNFLSNEYNKYYQNPNSYQRNNFDQNNGGGYDGGYGMGYNNGYGNVDGFGGQLGTGSYGISNNNGNLGGYNGGYGSGYDYGVGYG